MPRMLIRSENENVSAMRLHKIVAELVDENLITGVDGAACDYLASFYLPGPGGL